MIHSFVPCVGGKATGLGKPLLSHWLRPHQSDVIRLHLLHSYGLYVPYLAFTVVCVFCLLFTATCVPETRGRSLEEIENYFRTGRSFTILQ